MRYAILSDLHGNEPALFAVRKRLQNVGAEHIVCLGDLVGYNPFPAACLKFASEHCDLVIRGNHDKAVAIQKTRFEMNEIAEAAIRWTQKKLSAQEVQLLAELRAGPLLAENGLLICHGTPIDEDRYLVNAIDAEDSFRYLSSYYPSIRLCAFGHTHVPLVVDEEGMSFCPQDGAAVKLSPNRRYLLNPGSVGQPRDGDSRAAFGILDTERQEFTVHRIPYSVEQTQKQIRDEGLPNFLAERLAVGR